jgi:pyruvate-formate lyase-activating enzyme
MLGCDLHCAYCQNWVTSQALRDSNAGAPPLEASPELLVRDAIAQGARILVSTYNEPLITSEWAVAVFKQAKAAGLVTGFVSNGNATPQVLEYVRPWLDLYKVDLKSFDDRHYHELGGRIAPILDSIRRIHDSGLWLEIVTLLIRIPRRNLPRHSLAHHRIPRRLQNDQSPQHNLRRPLARRRNRPPVRPSLHLCRKSPRHGRRMGKHTLSRLQ